MKAILVAATGLLFSACAGNFERNAPEPAVYLLTAPVSGDAAVTSMAADLLVLRPVVAAGLRTERIATRWPGNRLDYYAGARWSGELGSVVQGALVEAIRATGRMRTVEGDPNRFRSTHVLGIEITRLEADYSASELPVARVTLTATLARAADRRALAAWTVSTETAAGANRLATVTAALDDAFGKAALEVVTRTAEAISTDLAGQP
jgi:ABC-type uncharacterized transport system auxiliary subunit